MKISGAAAVAGVVGAPIEHSLSPVLHNTWLEAAGIDGAYVPFPVAEDGFERFVEGMRGGAVVGVNVTAPFKERALVAADIADEAAQTSGAANLLLFRADGVVAARNTDGAGVLAALAEQAPRLRLEGAIVLMIGAGGAACGAAVTLLESGAAEVRVVNRTYERARRLAEGLGEGAGAWPWESLGEVMATADLVVNATARRAEEALDAPWAEARTDAVAMDMTYRPLRTPFLEGAAARGLVTVDGLAMLIGQARPSFEAFYGSLAPDVDVRRAALEALGETA